jgi:hypothetical protein
MAAASAAAAESTPEGIVAALLIGSTELEMEEANRRGK